MRKIDKPKAFDRDRRRLFGAATASIVAARFGPIGSAYATPRPVLRPKLAASKETS
jgi:hypothetical protein